MLISYIINGLKKMKRNIIKKVKVKFVIRIGKYNLAFLFIPEMVKKKEEKDK
jgi:hypothetical protein